MLILGYAVFVFYKGNKGSVATEKQLPVQPGIDEVLNELNQNSLTNGTATSQPGVDKILNDLQKNSLKNKTPAMKGNPVQPSVDAILSTGTTSITDW